MLLGPAARRYPRRGARQHAALRLRGAPEATRDGTGMKPNILSREETSFLVRQRVARLATADGPGEPHAIPVCFAYDGHLVHIALDEKPKNVAVTRLKRVRNILENPNVALVADRYSEDWDLLSFVMVRGQAELVQPGSEEHAAAVRLLRGKYHQYEEMK